MSKTTIALFVTLLIFIGILLFVVFDIKQNHILTSLTQQISKPSISPDTSLSFSTNLQEIQRAQTVTAAVLIHKAVPQTNLVQLEISYDPTVFTVEYITPGSFFTNPTIALQNIDPVTGRISYALHCPASPETNAEIDCINQSSSTIAIITLSVNPYAIKNTTNLSFLPKTVIRVKNGRDILQSTNELQLTIGKQLYPIASTSAIASPGANLIQVTPAH